MEQLRLAPTVGIVASLVVIAVLAAPYALVEGGSGVSTYFAAGSMNPLIVGLFAAVAVIVFAAGREGRSPPDLVAGAALVLGLFMTVIAGIWALTVPQSVVTQLSTAAILQYHRGALVVAALTVPVTAVWYARALRIL
jgi:glycerol-3-phosphate acyltransferase PlsY